MKNTENKKRRQRACVYSVYGGDEETRTPDPLLAEQVLSQLSYAPILFYQRLVGPVGVEPTTSRL